MNLYTSSDLYKIQFENLHYKNKLHGISRQGTGKNKNKTAIILLNKWTTLRGMILAKMRIKIYILS